jgi:hypothetical protein
MVMREVIVVPWDPRGFVFAPPSGRSGRFVPSKGIDLYAWQPGGQAARKNYATSRRTRTARIVTPIGRRNVERATAQLVDIVRRVGAPSFSDAKGTPFFTSDGLFEFWTSGRARTERALAVVVMNARHDEAALFRAAAVVLAEQIAKGLRQAEVIVQIQVAGISQQLFGVRP